MQDHRRLKTIGTGTGRRGPWVVGCEYPTGVISTAQTCSPLLFPRRFMNVYHCMPGVVKSLLSTRWRRQEKYLESTGWTRKYFTNFPAPAWIGYIDSTDLSNRVTLKSAKQSFKWRKNDIKLGAVGGAGLAEFLFRLIFGLRIKFGGGGQIRRRRVYEAPTESIAVAGRSAQTCAHTVCCGGRADS